MNRNAYDELRAHVAAMDPRAWALIDARERGDFEQEAEIERLKAANGVLDRNYHHMRELRDAAVSENERLGRDNATLRRLTYDIRDYALTPQPVLRSIEQAFLAIAERAGESRGTSDEGLLPEDS